MLLSRRFVHTLSFIVFALAWSATSLAQSLPGATATMQCNLEDKDAFGVNFNGTIFSRADSIIFNAACDDSGATKNTAWQENSDGFVISGPKPQALVQLETESATFTFPDGAPDCELNVESHIDALAEITFSVSVIERNVPQFRPASIPTRVVLFGQVSASVTLPAFPEPNSDIGENGAGARVEFRDANNVVRLEREIVVSEGSQVVPIGTTLFEDFLIDDDVKGEYSVLRFSKLAGASVGTAILSPCDQSDSANSSAKALIDPIFELDQERFDQTHGANSFPLAEFYEVVYSPNLFDLFFESGFEDFDTADRL